MDTVKAVMSGWTAISASAAPKSNAILIAIPSSFLSQQHKANNRWKLAKAATARRFKCGGVIVAQGGGGGGITTVDEEQFSDMVLKSERPVLVEFVADWCGPCRLISPAIQWVAQEYKEKLSVVKIDHDANPNLIKEYQVYGLPTLIVFKCGKEVPQSRKEGAITKSKLKDHLDAILDSIAVA